MFAKKIKYRDIKYYTIKIFPKISLLYLQYIILYQQPLKNVALYIIKKSTLQTLLCKTNYIQQAIFK